MFFTPRNLLPPVAAIACLWLLSQRLDAVDLPSVWIAVRDLGWHQWVLGGLATIGSLAAVGRYDVVMHRALGTGIAQKAAGRAGVIAIALSQTIGFGMISGALVRWRMLPELSLWRATKLTAIVAASFLAAWAIFTSVVVLILRPGFSPFEVPLAIVVMMLPLAMLGTLRFIKRTVWLPNLLVVGPLLLWVAVDTILAALALYWLLPTGTAISFAVLLPAFLIALGVGMISGSPAGLGAFELTLLALLPADLMAPCLAAMLAFRLVYYALPAVIALIPLALVGRKTRKTTTSFAIRPARNGMSTRQNTEAAMLRLDGGLTVSNDRAAWGVRHTPHTLTAMGTPLYGPPSDALPLLQTAARETARLPLLYKAVPRLAARARTNGWAVTRIAHEAVITPQHFSTDGPQRRQLRRALRKATDAGVETKLARGRLPEAEMLSVHQNWQNRTGPERGFSMGRFDLPYLYTQRVYLALQNNMLVGFISLHANPEHWVLDLMRQSDAAPTGTMHALICHAISDAAQAGVTELSLAAVPCEVGEATGLERFIRSQVQKASGADGLRRFKDSFAPDWRPRYLATRRKWHSALAILEIGYAIQNPQKGARQRLGLVTNGSQANEDYENYEIDSYSRACETAATKPRPW
ncbi:MAG: phosphatidylglycerol lysyltransferase domain-containing protein [Pseudomonadota bacterium]